MQHRVALLYIKVCLSWSNSTLRYFSLLKWWLNLTLDFYSLQTSEDQKILESSRLAGASGGLQCDCLLKTRLALISDQVSQDCVQLGLVNLQGWYLHSLSGCSVLPLGCLEGEKISLTVISKCFQQNWLDDIFGFWPQKGSNRGNKGRHRHFETLSGLWASWACKGKIHRRQECADTGTLAQELLRTKKYFTRGDHHA